MAYHRVETDDIPAGSVAVPAKVNDNGTTYHTGMVAGSVRVRATSSGRMLDGSCCYSHTRWLQLDENGDYVID